MGKPSYDEAIELAIEKIRNGEILPDVQDWDNKNLMVRFSVRIPKEWEPMKFSEEEIAEIKRKTNELLLKQH